MTRPNKKYFEIFASLPNCTFVETGLYQGRGVKMAIALGFEKIISIEPIESFIDNGHAQFRHQIENGQVKLVLGGSEQQLGPIVDEIDGPIIYWLDGHYAGEKQADEKNCPLNDELDVILARCRRELDVILIDDLRILRDQSKWTGHDIDLSAVIGRIMEACPTHTLTYLDGHVKNDILAAVPAVLTKQMVDVRLLEIISRKSD